MDQGHHYGAVIHWTGDIIMELRYIGPATYGVVIHWTEDIWSCDTLDRQHVVIVIYWTGDIWV